MYGDYKTGISVVVAQGTLLWQLIKFGRFRKRRLEHPLLFASAFDNILANRKSASFKTFNGNNQATLCPNLVNYRPIISEFMLLKRAIFAAIRPQFDEVVKSASTIFWGNFRYI